MCVCVCGRDGGERGLEKRGKLTGGEIISSNNCLFLKFTDAMRTLCSQCRHWILINKPSVMFPMAKTRINLPQNCMPHWWLEAPIYKATTNTHTQLRALQSRTQAQTDLNQSLNTSVAGSLTFVGSLAHKQKACLAVSSNETNKPSLTVEKLCGWFGWMMSEVWLCAYTSGKECLKVHKLWNTSLRLTPQCSSICLSTPAIPKAFLQSSI